MNLKDKLKSYAPMEETVTIGEDEFLVRGLGRVKKNQLVQRSQKKGQVDNEVLEGNLLAACVLDPATGKLVMEDPLDWDVPSHVSGPLVNACIQCCGFDDAEVRELEKKSSPTET